MGIRMRCSQGILLAAVIPYKLPRMGSTVSGTAHPASSRVLPSALQPVPSYWPGHAQQKGDVKRTVGDNGAVPAAGVLGLRLGEGWMWEVS